MPPLEHEKPTLAIFNLSWEGHHPRYVRWILESDLARNFHIVLAAHADLIAHAELAACAVPFDSIAIPFTPDDTTLFSSSSSVDLARREYRVRAKYKSAMQQIERVRRVDLALVPFLDDCINAIAVAGSPFNSVPWLGLTMRTQFHFSKVGIDAPPPRFAAARKTLFKMLLRQRTFKTLLTIDPTLIDYATRLPSRGLKKLAYVPDPCEFHVLPPRTEARTKLNIPEDAKVVLVYGALTERKGVFTLLQAAADPACPRRLHVLLAGKQYADMVAFLGGPVGEVLREQARIHTLPGYVPSTMESTLLAASDCMWLAYKEFYMMSSVFVLAARHGLPIVTSGQGVVGHLSREHKLGLQVDADSVPSVLTALQQVCDDASPVASRSGGPSAFAAHGVTEFQRVFSVAARNALADGVG